MFELLQLADAKSKCRYNTIVHFINLVEHIYGSLDVMSRPEDTEHDSSLFKYLQHYGRSKFANCSRNLTEYYRNPIDSLDRDYERELDALIWSQQDKQKNEKQTPGNENHLARLAGSLNLIEGKFNAKSMLRVVEQIREPEFGHLHDSAYYLTSFLAAKCSKLSYSFSKMFNVYNINRLLNPTSSKLSARLDKLNEYGRLCNQFEGQETHKQVVGNVKRSLSTSTSSSSKLIGAAKKLIVRCS